MKEDLQEKVTNVFYSFKITEVNAESTMEETKHPIVLWI
jgi:hypothetical protein